MRNLGYSGSVVISWRFCQPVLLCSHLRAGGAEMGHDSYVTRTTIGALMSSNLLFAAYAVHILSGFVTALPMRSISAVGGRSQGVNQDCSFVNRYMEVVLFSEVS